MLCNGEVELRKTTANAPSSLSYTGADVIPGIYEGGFKLWECASDLAAHVHRHHRESLLGKSVLEIGAGHALPSLVAARAGASITVHDFNEEVLRAASAPNVALNAPDATAHFASGDWRALASALAPARFDLVLSAETVYCEAQLAPLEDCVLDVLADGGVALFAGKTYYFGVGGGMSAFRAAVAAAAQAREERVEIRVVETLRDGKSNVREILPRACVTHLPSP